MRLSAKVYDPERGERSIRTVEAAGREDARASLEAQGVVILSMRRAYNPLDWRSIVSRLRRSKIDVRLLCVELSALLRAGLSLSEALESLASRSDGRSAAVYGELVDRMLRGLPLSDAMEQSTQDFPQILVAAVRANERTGRIADALDEFARFESALRDLRRKAVSAAVYPLLVVGFGTLVALFLLGYVVPRFSAIYDDTAIQVSAATRLILFVGRGIDRHALALFLVMMVAILAVIRTLSNAKVRRRLLASLLSRWPIASYARTFQLQRICQSLGMLMRGGYALPQALRLTGALASQPALQKSLRTATQAVEEGRSASNAWAEAGLGDLFARRILQAGERTGELSVGFDTLAATYARNIEVAMERSARLIEPALLMLVASLIGAIVVLMYMPIFDLAGTVQ